MNLLDLFHGGGRRRRSDENWNDLQRQLSDAQQRSKKVKGAVFHQCPTRDHGAYWVYAKDVACPWCTIDRLRGQLELVTARPAPRPGGIAVKAPADGAAITVPENEPVADVNAETQAVDVAELRNAMGEGDTQTLPAVTPVVPVLPDLPQVTWGVKTGDKHALEAWATATAPPPGAGATEVSPITATVARMKVAAATTSTD